MCFAAVRGPDALSVYLSSLCSRYNYAAIDDFGDSLRAISQVLPNKTIFSLTVQKAINSAPAYCCKKGSYVALPKNSKCVAGTTQVIIEKE
jgi:hypothetical protein